MTQLEEALSTIEEWKRKICEFSNRSDDPLVVVMARGIDVAYAVVREWDHSIVYAALQILDLQRICSWMPENKEPSLRTTTFGVLETLHATIGEMYGGKEPKSEVLATVTEWKRKTFELSLESEDLLITVMSRALDLMHLIIKGSELIRIEGALEVFTIEKNRYWKMENKELSLRCMIYGVLETVHITIIAIQKRHQSGSSEEVDLYCNNDDFQVNEEMKEDSVVDQIAYSEEPAYTEELAAPSAVPSTAIPSLLDGNPINDGRIVPGNYETSSPHVDTKVAIKEEVLDDMDIKLEVDDYMAMPKLEKVDVPENLPSKFSEGDMRRFSGRVSRPVLHYDPISDAEDEPKAKKGRARSVCRGRARSVAPSVRSSSSQEKASEVKCILCDAHPSSPGGYLQHLRLHHKEKASLAANGVYLKCGCGYAIRNIYHTQVHMKKCGDRRFSLHEEDVIPFAHPIYDGRKFVLLEVDD